jgi:hypothetical protein
MAQGLFSTYNARMSGHLQEVRRFIQWLIEDQHYVFSTLPSERGTVKQ